MFRINRETDYAIRVILSLAKRPAGAVTPSAEVRTEMDLPEALSLQIISGLVKKGFLNSFPGRSGGIQLSAPAREISLLDLITSCQGPLEIAECLDQPGICRRTEHCPVRTTWRNIRHKLEAELNQVDFQTLADGDGQPGQNLVLTELET
jgi:Rrf2 family nitric oxide-sensitive transcriptional repressor